MPWKSYRTSAPYTQNLKNHFTPDSSSSLSPCTHTKKSPPAQLLDDWLTMERKEEGKKGVRATQLIVEFCLVVNVLFVFFHVDKVDSVYKRQKVSIHLSP